LVTSVYKIFIRQFVVSNLNKKIVLAEYMSLNLLLYMWTVRIS